MMVRLPCWSVTLAVVVTGVLAIEPDRLNQPVPRAISSKWSIAVGSNSTPVVVGRLGAVEWLRAGDGGYVDSAKEAAADDDESMVASATFAVIPDDASVDIALASGAAEAKDRLLQPAVSSAGCRATVRYPGGEESLDAPNTSGLAFDHPNCPPLTIFGAASTGADVGQLLQKTPDGDDPEVQAFTALLSVRANDDTSGFVFATLDAVFTDGGCTAAPSSTPLRERITRCRASAVGGSNGTATADVLLSLSRGLQQVGIASLSDSPAGAVTSQLATLLGNGTFAVYSGLYMDGATKSLVWISVPADAGTTLQPPPTVFVWDGSKDDFIHKAFDGEWHQLAFVASEFEGGFFGVRLYIDGETRYSAASEDALRCAASPEEVAPAMRAAPEASAAFRASVYSDPGSLWAVTQGAIVFGVGESPPGAFLVQMYHGEMSQVDIAQRGSEAMRKTIAVSYETGVAIGAVMILVGIGVAILAGKQGYTELRGNDDSTLEKGDFQELETGESKKMLVLGTGVAKKVLASARPSDFARHFRIFKRIILVVPPLLDVLQQLSLFLRGFSFSWPVRFRVPMDWMTFAFSLNISAPDLGFGPIPPWVPLMALFVLALAAIIAFVFFSGRDEQSFREQVHTYQLEVLCLRALAERVLKRGIKGAQSAELLKAKAATHAQAIAQNGWIIGRHGIARLLDIPTPDAAKVVAALGDRPETSVDATIREAAARAGVHMDPRQAAQLARLFASPDVGRLAEKDGCVDIAAVGRGSGIVIPVRQACIAAKLLSRRFCDEVLQHGDFEGIGGVNATGHAGNAKAGGGGRAGTGSAVFSQLSAEHSSAVAGQGDIEMEQSLLGSSPQSPSGVVSSRVSTVPLATVQCIRSVLEAEDADNEDVSIRPVLVIFTPINSPDKRTPCGARVEVVRPASGKRQATADATDSITALEASKEAAFDDLVAALDRLATDGLTWPAGVVYLESGEVLRDVCLERRFDKGASDEERAAVFTASVVGAGGQSRHFLVTGSFDAQHLCPKCKLHLMNPDPSMYARVDASGAQMLRCVLDDAAFAHETCRLEPCRDDKLFVCPNAPACHYAVCESCSDAVKTPETGFMTSLTTSITSFKKNPSFVLALLGFMALSSVYLPATEKALNILACHATLHCEFLQCYQSDNFPLAGFIGFATVLALSVGVPLHWTLSVLRRRRMLLQVTKTPAQWDEFMERDSTVLANLYNKYEIGYMVVEPVLLAVRSIGLSAALAFTDPESLAQLLSVSVVTLGTAVFVTATEPFTDPWIDVLTKADVGHNLLQLGWMAIHRGVTVDDPANQSMAIPMYATFLIFGVVYAAVFAKSVIFPFFDSKKVTGGLELRRQEAMWLRVADPVRRLTKLELLRKDKKNIFTKHSFEYVVTLSHMVQATTLHGAAAARNAYKFTATDMARKAVETLKMLLKDGCRYEHKRGGAVASFGFSGDLWVAWHPATVQAVAKTILSHGDADGNEGRPDGELTQMLLDLVLASKDDDSPAGANAATLLAALGVTFDDLDLSGTQLAGARMSNTVVRKTTFCDADLSNADLTGTQFIDSDFRHAHLKRSHFGFLPRKAPKKLFLKITDGRAASPRLVYSVHQKLLAMSELDDSVRLLSLETNSIVGELFPHRSQSEWVAFSRRTWRICSADTKGNVYLWSSRTFKQLGRHFGAPKKDLSIFRMEFSPDDRYAAVNYDGENLFIFDVSADTLNLVYNVPTEGSESPIFYPTGRDVFFSSSYCDFAVISLTPDFEASAEDRKEHMPKVRERLPAGQKKSKAEYDAKYKREKEERDATRKQRKARLAAIAKMTPVVPKIEVDDLKCFSRDASYAIDANSDKAVMKVLPFSRHRDVQLGRTDSAPAAPSARSRNGGSDDDDDDDDDEKDSKPTPISTINVYCGDVLFTPDSTRVTAMDDNGTTVMQFDTLSGQCVLEQLLDLEMGEKVKSFVHGDNNNDIIAVTMLPADKAQNRPKATYSIVRFALKEESANAGLSTVHRSSVADLRGTADGRLFATAGDDSRVLLWDGETGACIAQHELSGTPEYVAVAGDPRKGLFAINVSDDVFMFSVAHYNDVLGSLDTSKCEALRPPRKVTVDKSFVTMDLDFTGEFLAIGDYRNDQKPVVVVNTATSRVESRVDYGQKATKTKNFGDEWPGVSHVAIGPECDWVASSHDDGSVYVWDFESGKLLARAYKVAKKDPSAPLLACNPTKSLQRRFLYLGVEDEHIVVLVPIPVLGGAAFSLPPAKDLKRVTETEIQSIRVNVDGNRVLVLTKQLVVVRDATSLKPVIRMVVNAPHLFRPPSNSRRDASMGDHAAISGDGEKVMLARDTNVLVWDVGPKNPTFDVSDIQLMRAATTEKSAVIDTHTDAATAAAQPGTTAGGGLRFEDDDSGGDGDGAATLSPTAAKKNATEPCAIITGCCDLTGNWVATVASLDEKSVGDGKPPVTSKMKLVGGTPELHQKQLQKANTLLAKVKGTPEQSNIAGLTRFIGGSHMPQLLRRCLFDDENAFVPDGARDTIMASRRKRAESMAKRTDSSESDTDEEGADDSGVAPVDLSCPSRTAPDDVKQLTESDSDDDYDQGTDDDDDEDGDDDVDDDVIAKAIAAKPTAGAAGVAAAAAESKKKSIDSDSDSWGLDTDDDDDDDDDDLFDDDDSDEL